MKRFFTLVVALLLIATTVVSAFAASNDASKAVVDKLSQTVKTSEGDKVFPADYITKAENYFNTIEMTAEQSDAIIAKIAELKTLVEAANVADFKALTAADKQKALDILNEALAALDMKAAVDKTANEIVITAPNGEVAFSVYPTLVAKDAATNGGSAANNATGAVKTTGAASSVVLFSVVGAAVLLIVAGGALFIVKSKKA